MPTITAMTTGTTMTMASAKPGLAKGAHQDGSESKPLQIMKSGRLAPDASSLRYMAMQ